MGDSSVSVMDVSSLVSSLGSKASESQKRVEELQSSVHRLEDENRKMMMEQGRVFKDVADAHRQRMELQTMLGKQGNPVHCVEGALNHIDGVVSILR